MLSEMTKKDLDELLSRFFYEGAGPHNSLFRGKYLGDKVTDEQYAAIQDGTFTDLFIGDYWTINGMNYRIAAFDYYYTNGDIACMTHHAVMVPEIKLYKAQMNETDTTEGGYVGSKMYRENLNQAKEMIAAAFGAEHILSHRQYFSDAAANGKPSSAGWYDSSVDLMNEQNVYGGKVFGVACDGGEVPALYTIDKSQFPLFTLCPNLINNRQTFWLRDVVSSEAFARVGGNGRASCYGATQERGVRPAFCLKG